MVFFGVRTVNYRTSFSVRFIARAFHVWVINLSGKISAVTYSTDLELVYWEVYIDNWFMNWTLPSNECCVRNAEYVWEPQRYFRNDSPKLLLFIDVGMTDLPRTHERGKQIGVFFHDLFVYFISFNRCVIYREKYYFSFPWHIETVRRTATRTCLLVCVCFIIRLRWSLEHFSVDCRKLFGIALVSSSSLSDWSRKNSRHFLSQSD